jgi:hypothetical protein
MTGLKIVAGGGDRSSWDGNVSIFHLCDAIVFSGPFYPDPDEVS